MGNCRWHCTCTVDSAVGAKGLKRGEKRGGGSPLQLLWPFPIFWPALLLMQYSSPDRQIVNDQMTTLSSLPWTASSAATDECRNCFFPLKPYAKGSKHEDVGHWQFYYRRARWFIPNEYWTPQSPSLCLRGVTQKRCQSCSCCTCAGSSTTWFRQEASSCMSLAVCGEYCNLDLGMQLVSLVPQKARDKEVI